MRIYLTTTKTTLSPLHSEQRLNGSWLWRPRLQKAQIGINIFSLKARALRSAYTRRDARFRALRMRSVTWGESGTTSLISKSIRFGIDVAYSKFSKTCFVLNSGCSYEYIEKYVKNTIFVYITPILCWIYLNIVKNITKHNIVSYWIIPPKWWENASTW